MGISRFPDPYQTRDDLSHASVFLVVLLLLVGVGAILFFSNAWLFAPVEAPAFLSPSTGLTSGRTAPTPAEPPRFTSPTPVPPLAGIPLRPTPNGTQTATPTPAGPTATPGTPTPAAPTPTVPATGRVGNTGGDGVYLRHSPRLSDTWIAYRDGTVMTLTGSEADGDGEHWLQVRDPHGNVGWIPARYLVR